MNTASLGKISDVQVVGWSGGPVSQAKALKVVAWSRANLTLEASAAE